jgi:hypothetical protein
MFIFIHAVIWLLCIAIMISTFQVIARNREARYDLVAASSALLFALPTIRQAQPGIPDSPTAYDGMLYLSSCCSFG